MIRIRLLYDREVLFLSQIDKIDYEFQTFNDLPNAFCTWIFTRPYRNEF